METAIWSSIIAALSALFGVALSARNQLRSQYQSQQFQYDLEQSKRQADHLESERLRALKKLTTAHRLLSNVAREFSITNLQIIWQLQMSEAEYDQKFMTACNAIDELRAFADLHEASLSTGAEKIYGQMSIFWGNFRNVLRLTKLGEKVDHQTPCFNNSHDAVKEIAKAVNGLKGQISSLALRHKA